MLTRILALAAIGLWVLLVGVAAFFFLRGMTTRSQDGRQAIALSASERDAVLGEMRGMLTSVQGILAGLSARDMGQVAAAARASGMAMAVDATPALVAKLPLAFKNLGFTVHRGFDALGESASQGEPPARILAQLSAQVQLCVSCHAAYRLP